MAVVENNGDAVQENEILSVNNLSHNHPLYLQPSDSSNTSLIGIQLSGSDNYAVWSRAMRIGILGRNKLGFIEGTCKRESYTGELADQWDRCNAIVLSWLMNSVSKDLLSGIVYASSASVVWNDLRERFDKVNGSRIFQLHREIAFVTQGLDPVSVYFSKLRLLWDEFECLVPAPGCDCVKSKKFVEHLQMLKLMQFLMGLKESHEQARSQILMMIPLPTVNKAYSMMIERENQKTIANVYSSSGESSATALAVSKGRFNNQKRNPVCDHCGGRGHDRDGCYKLIGYPDEYKRREVPGPGSNSDNTNWSSQSSSSNGNWRNNNNNHWKQNSSSSNNTWNNNWRGNSGNSGGRGPGGRGNWKQKQQWNSNAGNYSNAANFVAPDDGSDNGDSHRSGKSVASSSNSNQFFSAEQVQQILQMISQGNEGTEEEHVAVAGSGS